MARAKYFKAKGPLASLGVTTGKQFVDYHVGSEEPKTSELHGDPYYPTGSMSVKHTPLRYTPTFSNESTHPTGLSAEYLLDLSTKNNDANDWGRPVPHPDFEKYEEARDATNYAYRKHGPETPHTQEMKRREETALKRFSRTKDANPTTLFVEHPATTEITGAFFDPNMRAHAPIMASLIHQDFKTPITASDDLSEHSSRFVQKAQKMGLPVVTHDWNPTAKVTNDYGFSELGMSTPLSERTHASLFNPLNEIPEEKVKSARQNLKDMMRGKKAHMSPQFEKVEHPKLPGIE
jgi:hypothetical protein